ncbi:MAG: hypothetical protein Q8891_04695 [Bacteroidota bacterium]|nr:hypothetical protein [Bacteroidota bacterium]
MKRIIPLFTTLFIILFFAQGSGPSVIVVRETPACPAYVHHQIICLTISRLKGNWIKRGHCYVYCNGH